MIYAFTSCALNYVPKARILVESLRKHAPNVTVCLALSDKLRDYRGELEKDFDTVIGIEDIPEISDPGWAFHHSIVELSTAIKPFVLKELLARDDCEAVLYFDPDTVLFSNLDSMLSQIQEGNILLTPHLTEPEVSARGIEDNELSALKHGIYNLGYLGVRNTKEGKRFAQWWADRLKEYCRDDIPAGIFTDQRWIDLVPAFFNGVMVSRYPGNNVAPWNMTNRYINKGNDGKYTVNGKPLVFYHFTGFDSGAHHTMLSLYSNNSPAAACLFNWYKSEIDRAGGDPLSRTEWAFGAFDDGEKITKEQRCIYRQRVDLQQAFPNPFNTEKDSSCSTFKQWWKEVGVIELGVVPAVEHQRSTIVELPTPVSRNTQKSRSIIGILWLLISSKNYRAAVFQIIGNIFKLWGLKGVFALVFQKIVFGNR